jgi:uncharacterized protein (DUF362 family)
MSNVTEIIFTSYEESVPAALDAAGAAEVLGRQERILIKPNLVSASPPPVTTPAALVEAIVGYVREHSGAEIVIAEGTGDAMRETSDVFKALGYVKLADKYGLELVDLNTAGTTVSECAGCGIFPEMKLPAVAFESFMISAPVLKAHLFCKLTGTMKNMMGLLPPKHYGGGGGWKKSSFHDRLDGKIADLCRHRTPDLTVMDASVGLPRSHLSGPCCDPPVNRILAGFDARELDRTAAGLLGLDWRSIGHLRS